MIDPVLDVMNVGLDRFLYQHDNTNVLVALALLLLTAGVGRRVTAGSIGLLAIPDSLCRQHAIDAVELAPAFSAARRMAAWRRQGALVGALIFAVPVLIIRDTITLSLVAILAGATSGLAAAQWWRTSPPTRSVRVASLERRTVASLVGRTPMVLLAGTLLTAAAATAGWLWLRSQTGDKVLVSGHWTCSFHLFTPPLSGPAMAWAGALVATLVALTAATAIARRGADAAVAPPADLALRQAGIRTALGSAITVTAALAAGMLFMLGSLLNASRASQGHCGSTTAWDHAWSGLLLVAGLTAFVITMGALLTYVMFPGRLTGATEQQIRA